MGKTRLLVQMRPTGGHPNWFSRVPPYPVLVKLGFALGLERAMGGAFYTRGAFPFRERYAAFSSKTQFPSYTPSHAYPIRFQKSLALASSFYPTL